MATHEGTVCLGAHGAQNPHHPDRGIARYVAEHVQALHRLAGPMLHSIAVNPHLPITGNLSWLLGSRLLSWGTDDHRVSGQRHVRKPPGIYHVMSPFELHQDLNDLWPMWARRSPTRTVLTLYDLIPLVFSDHYLHDTATRVQYLARANLISQADKVLAISRATANDAAERLGIHDERITVIDAGTTAKFAEMYESRSAAQSTLATALPAVRPGFMLYVGGFEFRKNLERLITAYGQLQSPVRGRHQLVIACRMQPSEVELVHSWAKDAGIEEGRMVVTGYVTDAVLGALYHACELFVFPSFYEGSGLPILEAMSCGAPIAAANTSTGPEILGDEDATFDPYNPASIADCIAKVLGSQKHLDRLVMRSRQRVVEYTWDIVAQRSIDAYEEVLERRPFGQCGRQRIALVSPWPPERSGIADYNLRLAQELGQWVDVDVVVRRPLDRYPEPQERGVRLVFADSFRSQQALRQYDRIIYCMGNSAFHEHVYTLLADIPGVVIAHDVRLTGFYRWLADRVSEDAPQEWFRGCAEKMYAHRLPPSAFGDSLQSWEGQATLGLYMTREMQEHAEHVFVHSEHAREVLELDRGTLDRATPVAVMPFGMPSVTRREWRTPSDDVLIVSVGVVSEIKGIETLIGACALMASRYPGLKLVVAGPADDEELRRWRNLAEEMAPHVAVEFPGHLPADKYAHLLRVADVAVQLRRVSHGEASAAVADCLAAGVPTVVSELGWSAELPEDVVVRLPVDASAGQLAASVERMIDEPDMLRRLSSQAQEYAAQCSFVAVAERYMSALGLR